MATLVSLSARAAPPPQARCPPLPSSTAPLPFTRIRGTPEVPPPSAHAALVVVSGPCPTFWGTGCPDFGSSRPVEIRRSSPQKSPFPRGTASRPRKTAAFPWSERLFRRGLFGTVQPRADARTRLLEGCPLSCSRLPRGSQRAQGASGSPTTPGVTVLLFKHDLRVHDHPGLSAVEARATQTGQAWVLPLFVFDPAVLQGLPLSLLAPLLAAVVSLREALRERGSDLVVRVGPTSEVLAALSTENELGPVSEVLLEDEVESLWQDAVAGLEEWLNSLVGGQGAVKVSPWRTEIFSSSSQFPASAEHADYLAGCSPPLEPLPAPGALPPLPQEVDPGSIPSLTQLLTLRGPSLLAAYPGYASIAASSASEPANGGLSRTFPQDLNLREEAVESLGSWATLAHDPVTDQAAWAAVTRGEASAREALHQFLRRTEPGESLSRAVEAEELCPFASLPAIFGPALSLGLVSPRELHHAGLQACGSGGDTAMDPPLSPGDIEPPLMQKLFPDPWRRTGLAAVRHARAVEWHEILSSRSKTQAKTHRPIKSQDPQGSGHPIAQGPEADVLNGAPFGGVLPTDCVSVRHWRWQGALIEYAVAGTTQSSPGEKKDAVLLVHGFGAFWQHYRDVIPALAEQGHPVWALTLPGFGRSAKPSAPYSQYFWSQCVQDFIADIIKAPAHVAGNSIGGYTVASVAADAPQLVRSVILFNSAGKIDPSEALKPGDSPEGYRYSRESAAALVKDKRSNGPPRILVWAFSRALFVYLQSSTGVVIKRCYPNRPERADESLVREILRAATDPGAIEVVESVFFLPKPRPLNLLLELYGGPVLVLQGRNDPLNDAVARANAIKAACPGAAVEFLEAGHCPHDEVPELVAEYLLRWAEAPWCDTGRDGFKGAPGAALGEEGPLEVLAEEALLGAQGAKFK